MPQPGLAPPAGVTPNFDNPGSKGIVYFTIFINAFGIPIVTGLLAIRMYMRHHVSRDIGKDDVCCILGYIGYIGYCTVDLLFLKYGGGLHQWNVPETSKHLQFCSGALEKEFGIDGGIQACYATMVIYGPAAFATRCAILLFLTRIFSPFTRYCRWIYVAIGLMGFYYALMVILKAFICRPVAKFWDPSIEGSCFNQRSLILTDNVISLVADIIVLLIPCPLVNFLKIDRMAKIRIGTVFGAGGVACICSLVRLVEIVRYGADSDLTWAFTWINSWGILEVAIGLACACFPMVAMAWKHLRRPAKRLTAHPADSGYGSGKYEMSSRGKHNVR
ncbi:hypothetical protein K490DRAFT_23683, partial [Saccharata proteae CBS 121410]